MFPLALLVAAALPVQAAVKPGPFATFGDWAVACDNANRCALTTLDPDDAPPPSEVVTIMREAGPIGRWKLWLTARTDEDPFAIEIGGQQIGGPFRATPDGATIEGATARAIAAALPGARRIAVIDGISRELARISVVGLDDALRYMDAAQGRTGTVTAVIARGRKPASAVPEVPALPIVPVARPVGHASVLTSARIKALQRRAKCHVARGAAKAQIYSLDHVRNIALVPCRTTGDNPTEAVFLLDKGVAKPARLDATPGLGGWTRVPRITNGSYSNGSLYSYARKAPDGDCGISQHFLWDGNLFRLIEQAQMDVCRGNGNFLNTWRVRLRAK
ncbi:DUF1176 domain-containing protein [soil metagenome]